MLKMRSAPSASSLWLGRPSCIRVRFQVDKVGDLPHLWMAGWWEDYPDPDDYLRILWWFPPGWQSPVYDELVERARRAMDQEERMRVYQQADAKLIEEAPILPLAYLRFHMLAKPWKRGFRTSPLRWWFWKDGILEPH